MRAIDSRFRIINLIEHNIFCEKYLVEDMGKVNEVASYSDGYKKRYIMNIFKGEFINSSLFDIFLNRSLYYKNIIHRNIVEYKGFYVARSIDDELLENNVYYSLEEYIEFESLIDYKDLEENDKLKVVSDLLHALSYLHFRGEVYKYINFNNVLIYKGENGIETKLKSIPSVLFDNFAYSNNLKNYTQFVAPEVIYENKKTLGSDVFSLGVFLYYLLSSKDYVKYRYKEDLRDEFNEELKLVLKKMTNYIESDRYESILEIANELGSIIGFDMKFDDEQYYKRLLFDNLLISRKNEINHIVHFVKSKISQKSTKNLILVSGEDGVGKSRLLKEVNYLLGMDRINTYSVECLEESSEGYENIAALIKGIVSENTVDKKLIERYGNEVVKIIPELREFWGISGADVLRKEQEYLKINNRVSNFIGELLENINVVFFFDNIDKLSKNEQYILDYLVSIKGDSIVLVGSYNVNNENWNRNLTDLMNHTEYDHIHINNFSYDEAGELIKNILGIGYPPMNLITSIMNETKGNPRFIEEVLKNLFLKGDLYVSEYRIWHYNKSDLKNNDVETLSDTLVNILGVIDAKDKKIIQMIAVLNSAVESELLNDLFSNENINLNLRIKNLVEMNILNEKMGDLGFNYDFYYPMLREIIVDRMGSEEKNILHDRISEVLEDYTKKYNSKSYYDILIYHLVESNNYKKAIYYSVEYARHMKQLKVFSQSREYYQKALGLLRYERNMPLIVDILFEIADIFIKLGEIEGAYINLIEAKNIDFEEKDTQKHVEICSTLVKLYLNKKELEDAKLVLNEGISYAIKRSYDKGVLDIMLLYYEYYKAKGDNYRCDTVIRKGIEKSGEDLYYVNSFLLKKWEFDYNINGIEYPESYYVEAYDYFCENNNIEEMVKVLYKMAVLDIKHSKIFEARKKLVEGIRYLDQHNIQGFKENMYIELGETYVCENRLEKGIEIFLDTIDLAELNGNRDALFVLYMRLSKGYLEFDQFNKSNVYLKKARLEYDFSNDRGYLRKDYYVIHISYYLENLDVDRAKVWFDKFLKIVNGTEALYENVIDMYNFRDQMVRYGTINEAIVDKLTRMNYINFNIRDMRLFLLKASFYSYMYERPDLGKKLMDIDDIYSGVYDDKFFRYFRRNAKKIFERNHMGIISQVRKLPKDVNLKRLYSSYYLLGNIHNENNNRYKALIYYFEALEILKVIYYGLPDDTKEVFINNDILKKRFREKLFNIVVEVTGEEVEFTENPKSFNEFFMFDYLVDQVENHDFVQRAYDTLIEKRDWFEISHVIDSLDKDSIGNMKWVLDYLVEMTMSDKGYMFYLDNDNIIKDYITEEEIIDDLEIKELLKSQNNLLNGIMINRFVDINKSISDKSAMLIPITSGKKIENDRRRIKSDSELQGYLYLESENSINNYTGISFEKSKKISKILHMLAVNYNLKKMSTVDKLTGVYLRKYFEELAQSKIKSVVSEKDVFSIVMVDIDDFKYVNDTYGHRRGDKVLTTLGSVLNTTLREDDAVGRYGGEEFIIMLSNVSSKEAYDICEMLREKILDKKLMGEKETLTVSFGISSFPKDGKTMSDLVEKADQALYESKENGKNQVTIWNRDINDTRKRYDKLAGFFTGNVSRDGRIVQSLLDIVACLDSRKRKEDVINEAISEVIDITEGKCGTIIEIINGKMGKKYYKGRSTRTLKEDEMSVKLINKIVAQGMSNYFIDWDNSEYDSTTGLHQWNSYVSVPLENKGLIVGYIILSVPITEKEFDYNDYNIVKSIAPILGSLL
ncbi:MAG: diguanylate cyclase [Firmicutes bacterium]|jgi:diguanylate cyclase (GGDEF)-like protein|nr:diguanylate cyclase [Bacillota bacterium]